MIIDKAHHAFATLRNIATENFESSPEVIANFELNLNTAMHELHHRSEKVQELEVDITGCEGDGDKDVNYIRLYDSKPSCHTVRVYDILSSDLFVLVTSSHTSVSFLFLEKALLKLLLVADHDGLQIPQTSNPNLNQRNGWREGYLFHSSEHQPVASTKHFYYTVRPQPHLSSLADLDEVAPADLYGVLYDPRQLNAMTRSDKKLGFFQSILITQFTYMMSKVLLLLRNRTRRVGSTSLKATTRTTSSSVKI